ncbi:MAG: hypothetical protein J6386_11415 [Candidatus Synoicihabitans palmerolidicus]|nr:hypothetical protein [Candidatus Synoicihabitans palmerolidicus]
MVSLVWAARANDMKIVGEFDSGPHKRLSFVSQTLPQAEWVKLGGSYRGYRFISYDSQKKSAALQKNGPILEVYWGGSAGTSSTAPTPLPPEKKAEIRQLVYNNLRQLSSAADQFYLEHGRRTTTYSELVGPTKYVKVIVVVDGEDYQQLQFAQRQPLDHNYGPRRRHYPQNHDPPDRSFPRLLLLRVP